MGILINYTHSDEIYEKSYAKISKISLAYNAIERFITDDSGNEKLQYEKEQEQIAVVSVYTDKEASDNLARPLQYHVVPFEYDIDSGENIYKVAYDSINRSGLFDVIENYV